MHLSDGDNTSREKWQRFDVIFDFMHMLASFRLDTRGMYSQLIVEWERRKGGDEE